MLFKEKRKDANNHGIRNLHANIKASHSQASPVLPSSQKEKGRVQTVKDLVLHNTRGDSSYSYLFVEYFSVAGTWPIYRQGTQKGHHCLLTSCQKTGSLNYFSLHVLEGKRRKVWGLAVRRCLWAAPSEQLLALPAAQHQAVGSSTRGSTSWERSLCFSSLLSAWHTPELLRQQQFSRIWCCLCWKQHESFYLKGFQIQYFGGKALPVLRQCRSSMISHVCWINPHSF